MSKEQEILFMKKISALSNQTTLYVTFPPDIVDIGDLKKGDLLEIKIKKIQGAKKNVKQVD